MNTFEKRAEVFSAMTALNNQIQERSAKNEAVPADMTGKYSELDSQFESLTKAIENDAKLNARKASMERAIDSRDVSGVDTREAKFDLDSYLRSGKEFSFGGNEELFRSENTFTGAEGAFTVAQTMYGTLMNSLRTLTAVRSLPGVQTIATKNLVTIPVPVSVLAPAATKQGPSGSYSVTDISFGSVNLNAYKRGGIIKISEELLNDSAFDLSAWVAVEIANQIGVSEEASFISGSGVNATTGLLTIAGTYVGDTTITAVSSSNLTDAIIGAAFNIHPQCRKDAVLIVGDGLAKTLRQAKSSVGAYYWTPSLVDGQPDRFDGRPVYMTSAAPAGVGSGVVAGLLVDPNYLVIGDRVPMTLQRLNERYADEGFVGFKYQLRSDLVLKTTAATTRLIWA